MSLAWRLTIRIVLGMGALFAVFFISAGTVRYWQGWAMICAWIIPAMVFFYYFYRRDPALIERRMQQHEKVREQKFIMKAIYGITYTGFLLPGLDFRLGWTDRKFGGVPLWLEITSLALVEMAYLSVVWVFHVNRFASRTIQVEAGQPVITTGPYRWVRHPMYSASVIMFLFMPLALGSYFAAPIFALIVPAMVLRLLNEEKVLRAELPGYTEYCVATPYRLMPHLW